MAKIYTPSEFLKEKKPTEEKEHELDMMIFAHYGITDSEQQQNILS